MFSWLKGLFTRSASTPSNAPRPTTDPLLQRALLEQRKIELSKRTAKKRLPSSTWERLSQTLKDLSERSSVVGRGLQTIITIWSQFLWPVLRFFGPIGRQIARAYRTVYARYAFAADEQGERTVFSRQRSALTVSLLALFTLVAVYHLIFNLVPASVRFAYDAVAVNVFSYEGQLIFSKPDWVVDDPGVLSVFACRRYPCVGQDDSVEFRIRDSIYLDVVRTLTRFEPHDPGELAGAFLSEENQCSFRAYGVRVKYLGFYPYIIDATCSPVDRSGSSSSL